MLRWEKLRAGWLEGKTKRRAGAVVAKSVDSEDIIERIYSQTSGGTLPTPIPLGQMVDILTDFWEADGMYD